jgi:hypothetical protein
VLGADLARLLPFGHVRQHRFRRFAGHRGPRSQIRSLVEAAARLVGTDAEPLLQCIAAILGTQFGCGGFGGQLMDDLMLDGWQAAPTRLHASSSPDNSGVVNASNLSAASSSRAARR